MKKKDKPVWNGEVLDSTHELHFIWYLEELKEAGYILKHRKSASHELAPAVSKKVIKPNAKELSAHREYLKSKLKKNYF